MINVKPKILTSKPIQPVSKTLKIFFIFLHIVFAYDYGFIRYKSTRHKFVIKLGTAVLFASLGTLVLILIAIETNNLLGIINYFIWIVSDCTFVIMLLIIPEQNTFYNFQRHLQWIDSKINVDTSSYYLEYKMLLVCFVLIVYKIGVTIFYCLVYNACIKNVFTYIMYIIPYSSMEIPIVIHYFAFHATYMRLVALRKFMNTKKFKPQQTQILYKSLHDSVEYIKNAFDPLFIFRFLTNLPCVMIIMYNSIKDTKERSKNIFASISEAIMASIFIAKIFAPAIGASSLSTEVDKIKVVLHEMLLVEKDETKIQDIKRFISYIEARPFKFRVLKIIHLDSTLPVAILNLCVTYLIVLLQLTHIY